MTDDGRGALEPPRILVFDSGVGGLSVQAALLAALPQAAFVYVADDAAFPYGRLAETVLVERVISVIGKAIERFDPTVVVIACNTASTVALPGLRAHFPDRPFVGTVPAVKPAAQLSASRMISVLGTPGTVKREYTHDLIITHAAECRVTLVGAEHLAGLAEQFLRGESVSDQAVRDEIAPCFRERDGQRTDAVVLACTHYPLLVDAYRRVAPWPVTYVDPAPAIARRVSSLLEDSGAPKTRATPIGLGPCHFTSGRPCPDALQPALARHGLSPTATPEFVLRFDEGSVKLNMGQP